MTVYTVIGYITNAILTFEPLPIPSNLSGGPQLQKEKKKIKMNIRILPYSPQISDLGSQINSKRTSNLDTFLIDQKFNHAEHWRSFQLLILREYVMSKLVLDYAENENKVSFRDWLNSTNATLWSNGIDATRLTEDQEHQMIQSAKEKLLSVWEKLPKTCQNLKSAEDMLASIERHIFRKGLDSEKFLKMKNHVQISPLLLY